MKNEGIITIQVNYRGEIIDVKIDGKRPTKTGNLAKNPPSGVIKGIFEIPGQILHFEQPGGEKSNPGGEKCTIVFHWPDCTWVCH